jgi:DNA-binding transcriptional LysR family regulator
MGSRKTESDSASLQAFVTIARSGTVGQAARRLGRTQPTISARLATLESAWGTRLFRRQARGMVLTPEGERLLPRAEAILRDLSELDGLAGRAVTPSAQLRIGSGDALGRELLPGALARLLATHPGLDVRLREGPGPVLLEALRAGEIDLALVVGDPAALASEGLDVAPVRRSEVVLLGPPGTLGKRRTLSLRSLAGERLVLLQQGSSFRRHVEAAFSARGLTLTPDVVVGNLSLVRRFVAAGLGMAPVPAVAFNEADPHLKVDRRALAGVPPVTYCRALRYGAPLTESVRDLLRSMT